MIRVSYQYSVVLLLESSVTYAGNVVSRIQIPIELLK